MKQIKNKMIIQVILLVLSIGGIVVSTIYDNSFGIGFFSSILGFSSVTLLRLSSISKSETKIKEYRTLEKDECLKLLNNEARSISFCIISILLLILGCVGYIYNNETMLFLATGTTFVGVISYLIVYTILTKIK